MYIIVDRDKTTGKYGIKDTYDSVIEYYTKEEIDTIVKKYGIKVKNYDKLVEKYSKDNNKISSYKDVIDDFLTLMKKESVFFDKQIDIENGHASVKDWGSWHVPEDAYNEYDEDEIEDYDWEELDREWYNVLKNIKTILSKKYPDVAISIYTSEKNWIDLSLERRNK